MNEQEKSLKLAELMGWQLKEHVSVDDPLAGHHTIESSPLGGAILIPYCNCAEFGLAQFAAILLKFPEAMKSFCHIEPEIDLVEHDNPIDDYWIQFDKRLFTQENFLDAVLIMNGVSIDENAEK